MNVFDLLIRYFKYIIEGLNSMNTKSLVTFKTILEMGSFQKAADRLGYTQSTVTFQIKQLEEELALKLFEKIGRRMELTQAGILCRMSI